MRTPSEIRTLADARDADYLVEVVCDRCSAKKRTHPYKLMVRHTKMIEAPLGQMLPGFWCKTCRSSVWATIYCTHTRPGGM